MNFFLRHKKLHLWLLADLAALALFYLVRTNTSLMNAVALNSAFANDKAPDLAMAQQVLGLGRPEDILIGISTSGNSANVIYAVQLAKTLGIKTIGLIGNRQCRMQNLCDIVIAAPELETYKIQEYHLPIYHLLCIAVENEFFEK